MLLDNFLIIMKILRKDIVNHPTPSRYHHHQRLSPPLSSRNCPQPPCHRQQPGDIILGGLLIYIQLKRKVDVNQPEKLSIVALDEAVL